MTYKSYPRPLCERCGMPMTLRTDTQKWFCETCHEFTAPKEPPPLEPRRPDPARSRKLWIRWAVAAAVLFLLAFIRIFVI